MSGPYVKFPDVLKARITGPINSINVYGLRLVSIIKKCAARIEVVAQLNRVFPVGKWVNWKRNQIISDNIQTILFIFSPNFTTASGHLTLVMDDIIN